MIVQFATLETSNKELKPKNVPQLFPAKGSLLGICRSAIGHIFSLPLVTVPKVFAKVNSAQFPLVFTVTNRGTVESRLADTSFLSPCFFRPGKGCYKRSSLMRSPVDTTNGQVFKIPNSRIFYNFTPLILALIRNFENQNACDMSISLT